MNLQRLAIQQSHDEKDLPPVFIASIILAHLSWLLFHSDEGALKQTPILGTYYLCIGVQSLTTKVSADWSTFASLGLEDFLEAPIQPSSQEKFMAQVAQDSKVLLNYIQNTSIHQQSKEMYRQVLREMWRMYTLVTDDCVDVTTKEHTVINHLHRVPRSYIRLIEREEPLALALLARTYALLALLRNTSKAWYIHGAGKYPMHSHTVRIIQKFFTSEWMWLMEWPLRIITDGV